MEKNNEQQELDLFSLLRSTFNFLCNILKQIAGFFGYLLRVTVKYYLLFLLSIFVAVAYSYYSTHGSRRVYRAEFTLSLNDGNLNLYSEMMTSLNRYLAGKDPDGFDNILQIPSAERGKVCAIGNRVVEDSTRLKMVIAVLLNDPDAFPVVEKALIDYFKNNDYLKSLNVVRIASLKEREKLFGKDIAEIDSLQKIEYFQKTNETGVKLDQKLVFKTDKQMFYTDKLNLLAEKEAVTKELTAKSEIVSLVNEFPPGTRPFVTLPDIIVKNIVIAFLLFLFLSLLWDNRKPIIDYLRKK